MRFLHATVVLLVGLVGGLAQAEVSIEWVTVGSPGNPCDSQSQGCFGAVAKRYRISKYEVTNAQYAEFLNAVAATDTYELYSTYMASPGYPYSGGITRSGSPGSYSYSAIPGCEEMPVNYVSFYDALRFANWLHNGQPTGAQDSTTTEDGAYTMIEEYWPQGIFITRNAGASVFVPSEDEWYKAAYYDPASGGYFDYPTATDVLPTCAAPGPTPNTENCNRVVNDLTDVGSYTGSVSPIGTFDQAGNVWEWNEATSGGDRGLRGGGFIDIAEHSEASVGGGADPPFERNHVGFRVASPPPAGCGLGVELLFLLPPLMWLRVQRRRAT